MKRRRALLGIAGVGTALAGCSVGYDPGNGGTGTETPERSISVDSTPLSVRTGRPEWDREGAGGRAIVIDGEERERAVLAPYDLPAERREAIDRFREGIDYGTERLVLLESAGPDACHDRLDVESVTAFDPVEIDAAVRKAEGADACAEVVTYPSTLVRIAFEADPVDAVEATLTDGWGEETTLSASASDPLAPDPADIEGVVRPEGAADPIASFDCGEENVRRHPPGFDGSPAWGDVAEDGDTALSMRVGGTAYEYGETARIRLRNVADRTVSTGNDRKFNLQVRTDDGWTDVRVGPEDRYFPYTDEAVGHPPGEGFDWEIELTEGGIERATPHEHATVCPDLRAGRYRFVYWGVIGGAVAVAFDLRR